MIYMFLSNNPSSGDINLSNLPCSFLKLHGKIFFETHNGYILSTRCVVK